MLQEQLEAIEREIHQQSSQHQESIWGSDCSPEYFAEFSLPLHKLTRLLLPGIFFVLPSVDKQVVLEQSEEHTLPNLLFNLNDDLGHLRTVS